MDSEIKELMEYIEASSFVEFELEREGFKIKLVKRAAVTNGPAGSAALGGRVPGRPPGEVADRGHVLPGGRARVAAVRRGR